MKTIKHNVLKKTFVQKINTFKVEGREQKFYSLPKHNVLQILPLQVLLQLNYIMEVTYVKK
jgi:hypothetical protein